MATVNLGLIKFRWQGAYAGGTAYVKDDVVSYNGSSYVCILASTGNLPTNTTYWNVMAQGGTDITSISGLAQGDILYYNGTDWVRLGAGTNGQFLKTQGTSANPVWGTVTSGIINIYQYYRNDIVTVNTGNSGAAVITSSSITPTSTSSVFYVDGCLTGGTGNDGTSSILQFSSNDGSSYSDGIRGGSWGSTYGGHGGAFIMQDQDNGQNSIVKGYFAPSTTNAIKIRLCVSGHSNSNIYINHNSNGVNTSSQSTYVSTMRIYEVDGGAGNGNVSKTG